MFFLTSFASAVGEKLKSKRTGGETEAKLTKTYEKKRSKNFVIFLLRSKTGRFEAKNFVITVFCLEAIQEI
jgi:hypothetical protein